jgi:4-oxalocrotonate tautomerase
MPIVHVELFEGRSLEQKRQLVQGITETVARTCGVSADGVHVLIDEMTRENWARGAVLNSDRQSRSRAEGLTEFVVVEQRTSKRDGTLPQSAALLGRLSASGIAHEAALEISSYPSSDAWQNASANGDAALAQGLTLCDRVDLPDGGGLRGFPKVERYMSISTHEVQPENLDRYMELRRIAVNPGMARLLGFVSSDVLRKRNQPNAFFIVNQWLRKEDADAYTASPLHAYLSKHVRAMLVSHSGVKDYRVCPV